MVQSMNTANSYGNIQRLGIDSDNRVIYRVIDSQGNDAGKMSISQNDVDKFEKSYITIMDTAPKIKQFVSENSSPKDINRRKNLSRGCIALGGIIGASVPLILTKNSSTAKKIISTITGIIAGICAGFIASLSISTPPGAFKFAKAVRTISQIDVKKFDDSTKLQATRM